MIEYEKIVRESLKKTDVVIVIFIIMVFLSACSHQPGKPGVMVMGDYDYSIRYMDWYIQKLIKQQEIAGLSIAIIDDQKIIWQKGYGKANEKPNAAATENTIYRAGSVSKLFTGLAIMQLVEREKLDLDKPIIDYLPEFNVQSHESVRPITVRDLLTHHSGLLSDLHKGMWSANSSLDDLIPLLNTTYLTNKPGEINSYSNAGYALLGVLIERISQTPFNLYMQKNILSPLAMNDSQFSQIFGSEAQHAMAYFKTEEKSVVPLRDTPAGGLNTSVKDLSQFVKAIFADGDGIVSESALQTMLTDQNENVALDFDVRGGLSWWFNAPIQLKDPRIGLVAQHFGATFYHRAGLVTLPKHKLGVVVMSNTSNVNVHDIATKSLMVTLEAKYGWALTLPDRKSFTNESHPDIETGLYSTNLGPVNFIKNDDGYTAHHTKGQATIVTENDGYYGVRTRLLGFIPYTPEPLKRIRFNFKTVDAYDVIYTEQNGEKFLAGVKLKNYKVPMIWQRRVGQYEIINSDKQEQFVMKDIRVEFVKNLLLLSYELPIFADDRVYSVLQPLNEKFALTGGLGRGKGETIEVLSDDPTGETFQFAGLRLARITN